MGFSSGRYLPPGRPARRIRLRHQLRCLQLCRLVSGFPHFSARKQSNPERTLSAHRGDYIRLIPARAAWSSHPRFSPLRAPPVGSALERGLGRLRARGDPSPRRTRTRRPMARLSQVLCFYCLRLLATLFHVSFHLMLTSAAFALPIHHSSPISSFFHLISSLLFCSFLLSGFHIDSLDQSGHHILRHGRGLRRIGGAHRPLPRRAVQ